MYLFYAKKGRKCIKLEKIGCSVLPCLTDVGVAQLFSARPSELEVPGSILGDCNVYFDFLLICVALALNTRKTEQ